MYFYILIKIHKDFVIKILYIIKYIISIRYSYANNLYIML